MNGYLSGTRAFWERKMYFSSKTKKGFVSPIISERSFGLILEKLAIN
jgi:hypothetical protein